MAFIFVYSISVSLLLLLSALLPPPSPSAAPVIFIGDDMSFFQAGCPGLGCNSGSELLAGLKPQHLWFYTPTK